VVQPREVSARLPRKVSVRAVMELASRKRSVPLPRARRLRSDCAVLRCRRSTERQPGQRPQPGGCCVRRCRAGPPDRRRRCHLNGWLIRSGHSGSSGRGGARAGFRADVGRVSLAVLPRSARTPARTVGKVDAGSIRRALVAVARGRPEFRSEGILPASAGGCRARRLCGRPAIPPSPGARCPRQRSRIWSWSPPWLRPRLSGRKQSGYECRGHECRGREAAVRA
jgi:hypothetical protein